MPLIAEPQKVTLKKYRFSADEYQKMGEIGLFANGKRVELINGEIIEMSPISNSHNAHVDKISQFLIGKLSGKAQIRTQGSVRLNDSSEPEPDIVAIKYREDFYLNQYVSSDDILVLVEVALHSSDMDRSDKKRLYASSGIQEYWIVLPKENLIEIYHSPQGDDYSELETLKKDENWFSDQLNLPIKGSDLLI